MAFRTLRGFVLLLALTALAKAVRAVPADYNVFLTGASRDSLDSMSLSRRDGKIQRPKVTPSSRRAEIVLSPSN